MHVNLSVFIDFGRYGGHKDDVHNLQDLLGILKMHGYPCLRKIFTVSNGFSVASQNAQLDKNMRHVCYQIFRASEKSFERIEINGFTDAETQLLLKSIENRNISYEEIKTVAGNNPLFLCLLKK